MELVEITVAASMRITPAFPLIIRPLPFPAPSLVLSPVRFSVVCSAPIPRIECGTRGREINRTPTERAQYAQARQSNCMRLTISMWRVLPRPILGLTCHCAQIIHQRSEPPNSDQPQTETCLRFRAARTATHHPIIKSGLHLRILGLCSILLPWRKYLEGRLYV
jgi:hypothetical protein